MAIADTCSPPGTDKRMTMREWQLLWSLNTCFLTTPTCSAARSKIGVSFKVNYTSRGNKTWDFQNYINVGKENFSMLLDRVQCTFCENMSKTLTDRSLCRTCWSKLGNSLSVIGGPRVAGVCHPVLQWLVGGCRVGWLVGGCWFVGWFVGCCLMCWLAG